jgi:mannan endo-1,4-beta-mannosidase
MKIILPVAAAAVIILGAGAAMLSSWVDLRTYPHIEAHIAPKLVNSDPSPEAAGLYEYLKSIYGRKVISGQQTLAYTDQGESYEDVVIEEKSGRLPALNGFDLLFYFAFSDSSHISRAIEWSGRGGIVAFSWHWPVPDKSGGLSFYSDKTGFDIRKAVTPGTTENARILDDLKRAADQLQKLKDAGVPVLWRPLHEADLRCFWWGRYGPEPYKKLWGMMYDYMVRERGLNNLIWVWNGQNKNWLVPEGQFDIASTDIYPRSKINRSSQVNRFNKIQGMAPDKLVALSECEFIPDPDNLVKDQAGWLWYMTWQAEYIYMTGNDANHILPAVPHELNPKYIDDADLQRFMNSGYVITLDELPASWNRVR